MTNAGSSTEANCSHGAEPKGGPSVAKQGEQRQAVPLEEVVLAQSFELEALLNVLDRKGLIVKAEVLEEIKRLRLGQARGK